MAKSTRSFLTDQLCHAGAALRVNWRVLRQRGPSQIQFWLIALIIGVAAGFAALFFRKGINALQAMLYGTDDVRHLHSFAQYLPWYMILLIPIIGGLVVGLILNRFTPDGRVRAVADVIEGAALHKGRVEVRAGLASAVASLITLSSGGSSGREGPVVHLAGVISTWVANHLRVDGITGRDLLGCAVAAAVSASFNAPIAGTLFALEVVLRHFAVHAFTPIVIASAAGTVITRLEFGDVPEFTMITPGSLEFYAELPAFVILGLLCGIVAVLLMHAVFWADDLGDHAFAKTGLPRWLRPAIAGAMLGGLAIWFPHIIGVGYETTRAALGGGFLLYQAVIFVVIKVIAVAITIGGRMGGGVFSPSLMIGALTGLAFGLVATGAFPDVSGTHTLYAFVGMGAVAAAVLGAPISTMLIVFELTGDWQIGLAVMIAVSMSTALASRLVDRSFFLTQIERRGIHVAAGPQAYLLAMLRASSVMRMANDLSESEIARCHEMISRGLHVKGTATLEEAMPIFDHEDLAFIAVVSGGDGTDETGLIGALFHIDALKAHNRALAATAAEEHS